MKFSFCLVFLLGVWGLEASSLCQFTAGNFYSRNEVFACFEAVPFTESVRVQTLDALNKTKELYAFVDEAVDSPDQENLPVSVNLQESLNTIAHTQYQNAFQFHDTLRNLYVQLNDAHTQFYLPSCYQNFEIRQPIPPNSYVNEHGENVIFVSRYMSEDLIEYVSEHYNFDLQSLIGAEILTVNSVSAFQYFKLYSETNVGMSKDPGTRFHVTMTQPQPNPTQDIASSSYWQTRTKRNPFPETDSETYQFKYPNGTVIQMEFNWTFKAGKDYSGFNDFLSDYYAAGQQPLPNMETVDSIEGDLVQEVKLEPIKNIVSSKRNLDQSNYIPLVNNDVVYFYALNDSQTLVMYINTMIPFPFPVTYKTINEGFTIAAEMGLTRLILDLTNNGGGSICFGRAILAYLQGQRDGYVNWGPQDLPLSPLQANLTETAAATNVSSTVWSPGFYRDNDNNQVPNDDVSAIMPGFPHVRGGLERNYSSLLHINNCGFWGYYFSPEKDFQPKDIQILTHGFCGSTCALVANHASLYDGIKTVVAGGIGSRPQQQYTSFPGLQVVDSPGLYNEFEALGYDTSPKLPARGDVVPRQLPTTASYRYCIREIYPPQINTEFDSTQPMEYTFLPATNKIDDTMVTAENPEELWYQILPFFEA